MSIYAASTVIMGAISLYVSLFHFFFYLSSGKNRSELHFTFVCLSVALYDLFCALFYRAGSISEGIWFQRGQFASISLMALLIYTYVLSESKQKYKKADIGFILFYSIYLILPWIPGRLFLDSSLPAIKSVELFSSIITYYEAAPGLLLQLEFLGVFGGIGICFYRIIQEYRKTKSAKTLNLIFGFSIFAILAAMDMINASGLITTIYMTEYAFFSLILMVDVIMIQDFFNLFRKDHLLNVALEKKVTLRVKEIERLSEDLKQKNESLAETNQVLKNLAERDGLTGLINHATFQKRLQEVCNMAWRNQFPMTVVMIDVDDFKQINDKWGHPEGDRILCEIADIFKKHLRDYDIKSRPLDSNSRLEHDPEKNTETHRPPATLQLEPDAEDYHEDGTLRSYDIAARYGGDEFTLILPFCDRQGADAVLNRIFEKVNELKESGNTKAVGLSCGYSSTSGKEMADPIQMIKQADEALYAAKKAGKNNFRGSAYIVRN